jgi:hypothetical protein
MHALDPRLTEITNYTKSTIGAQNGTQNRATCFQIKQNAGLIRSGVSTLLSILLSVQDERRYSLHAILT